MKKLLAASLLSSALCSMGGFMLGYDSGIKSVENTSKESDVTLSGLNDRCLDWKLRVDCRDDSKEGWDFLYINKEI